MNTVLVVEENSYASKIVSTYIVFDLDTWSKNPLNNFLLKNSDKEKWGCSGCEIKLDSTGSWNFEFARNFIIFGIDKSSSPHAYKHKNNLLVLG